MKTRTLAMGVAMAALVAMPMQAQESINAAGEVVALNEVKPIDLGALASIPADSEIWMAFNVKNINAAILKAFPIAAAYPGWLHLLDSVAIGIKPESEEYVNNVAAHYGNIIRLLCIDSIVTESAMLGPDAQSDLARFAKMYTSLSGKTNTIEYHEAGIEKNSLWPEVRVAVKARPGCELLLYTQVAKAFRSMLSCYGEEQGATNFSANGWTGITCTKECLINLMVDSLGISEGEMSSALPESDLHVAYKVQDGAVVVAVSPEIDHIINAGMGGNSLLQTDKVNFVGEAVDGQALAAFYISPKALNQAAMVSKTILKETTNVLEKSLMVLASSRAGKRADILKGVDGIREIHRQLDCLLHPHNETPATFVAWNNGNIHMLLERDSYGASFARSELRMPTTESPFALVLSSPFSSPQLPDINKLVPAVQSLSKAVELSFDGDTTRRNREMFEDGSAYVISCLQVLNTVGRNVYDTLSGGMMFTMDFCSETSDKLQFDDGSEKTYKIKEPCFTLHLPVTDKQKFENNWTDFVQVSQGVISLVDWRIARDIARALTFSCSCVDETTKVYRHAWGSQPEKYGYIVADTGVTVCTDMNRAVGLVDNDSTVSGCGAFISVNLRDLVVKLTNDCEVGQEKVKDAEKNPSEHSVRWLEVCHEISQDKLTDVKTVAEKVGGVQISIKTENNRMKTYAVFDTHCLK